MFFLHILILYHLLEEVIFTLYYLYTTTNSPEALERCCKDAVLAGKCNYSYICNTISTYHKEPSQSTASQSKPNEDAATTVSGTYKDDDSKYSLKNLLKRQETEAGYEE